jgi:hypothetical protein
VIQYQNKFPYASRVTQSASKKAAKATRADEFIDGLPD